MRVTQINFSDDKSSRDTKLKRAEALILNSPSSDLYMLPELWDTGFSNFTDYAKNKEPVDGDTVTRMCALAKTKNAYIFMGSFPEERDTKIYNTAVLIDRQGSVIKTYSKIHLFGDEKNYMENGTDIAVCDTEFGRVGLSICYDMRFGELYRKMTDMGAEIFLVCAAWPKVRAEHWDIFNRVRGLENQAIMLSCCSSKNGYAGISYGVLPDGKVVSKSDNEVVTFDIDTGTVKEYRKNFSVLKDRQI
ncbi:MAG: carbon-nitrogen family hydrolase [Clostridia bacterium]|nr:carbon-nitrogen family hydrolase [Clostridia bacterium]